MTFQVIVKEIGHSAYLRARFSKADQYKVQTPECCSPEKGKDNSGLTAVKQESPSPHLPAV